MPIVRSPTAAAISVAIVCVLTAILWCSKLEVVGPRDPVFFYLFPLTLIAFRYGPMPAFIGVFLAAACADYFLYEPLYTLDICSRAELGDLCFFVVLAIFAVKAASSLAKPAPTSSRHSIE